MVTTLMVTAIMASLGYSTLKIYFEIKIMTSFHDVTNKNLSRNSYHLVDLVMRLKFGNSTISKGQVIITSIL